MAGGAHLQTFVTFGNTVIQVITCMFETHSTFNIVYS